MLREIVGEGSEERARRDGDGGGLGLRPLEGVVGRRRRRHLAAGIVEVGDQQVERGARRRGDQAAGAQARPQDERQEHRRSAGDDPPCPTPSGARQPERAHDPEQEELLLEQHGQAEERADAERGQAFAARREARDRRQAVERDDDGDEEQHESAGAQHGRLEEDPRRIERGAESGEAPRTFRRSAGARRGRHRRSWPGQRRPGRRGSIPAHCRRAARGARGAPGRAAPAAAGAAAARPSRPTRAARSRGRAVRRAPWRRPSRRRRSGRRGRSRCARGADRAPAGPRTRGARPDRRTSANSSQRERKEWRSIAGVRCRPRARRPERVAGDRPLCSTVRGTFANAGGSAMMIHRPGRPPCIEAALLLLAVSLHSAGAQLLGPEFQVNSYTTNAQAGAAVAADGTGKFLVVWQSDLQNGAIRERGPRRGQPVLRCVRAAVRRGGQPRRKRVPGQHLHHRSAGLPGGGCGRPGQLRCRLAEPRPGRLARRRLRAALQLGWSSSGERVPGQHLHDGLPGAPGGGGGWRGQLHRGVGERRAGRREHRRVRAAVQLGRHGSGERFPDQHLHDEQSIESGGGCGRCRQFRRASG